jgi:hypothetical protein
MDTQGESSVCMICEVTFSCDFDDFAEGRWLKGQDMTLEWAKSGMV